MDAYKQADSTTLELKGVSVEWPCFFKKNEADLDLDCGTAST